MSIKKYNPGDSFDLKASEWNAIAEHVNQGNTLRPQRTQAVAGGNGIDVENLTGADLEPFQICRLVEPIFGADTFPNEPYNGVRMKVEASTASVDRTKIGIALGPILDAKVGQVAVDGTNYCLIDIQHDGDLYANVAADGDVTLTSGHYGYRIVWQPSGTGEQLCLVNLSEYSSEKILAKITAVHQADGEVSATEVLPDATDGDRTWDGGALPNLPKLKLLNPLDLPLEDDIVKVFYGLDENDAEIWSCQTKRQQTIGKVASVDQAARTVTATEVIPNGNSRTDARSLGTLRIIGHRLPQVGEFLKVDYGYNATGGVEWYSFTDTNYLVTAKITSSASGSASWSEVSPSTFALVTDGLSGTNNASIPNGWQAVPDDTIVTLLRSFDGTYSIVSIVRGLEGVSNPETHNIEGRTTAPVQFNVDQQTTKQGLIGYDIGNLYAFDEKGFAFDRYQTVFTSEGQLQDRQYVDSTRVTGDADPDDRLIGHVGMIKQSDDTGDDTWLMFLGPPTDPVASSITFDADAGNSTLEFDDSGRYKGGNITIDLGTALPVLEFDIVTSVDASSTELTQTVKRYRIPAELISTTTSTIEDIDDCGDQ